jgi:hypothetical protein
MFLARSLAVSKSALTVAAVSVSQTVYGKGKNDLDPTLADSRYVFDSSNFVPNSEVLRIDEKQTTTEVIDDKISNDSESVGSIVEISHDYDFLGDVSTYDFHNPSMEEVESAVEVMREIPHIQSFLFSLPVEKAREMMARTAEMAYSSDFRNDVRKKMDRKLKEKAIEQNRHHEPIGQPNVEDDIVAKWDKLVDNNRCAFCQDLLASPMLLKCTHSFCFHCLQENANRCQPAEDILGNKAEVAHKCPLCPQEFKLEDAIFERTMDHNIAEQALLFPEPLKKDWEERRQVYVEHQKQQAEEERRANEERYCQQLQKEEAEERQRQYNEWTSLCNKYVPYFAFIAVVIIGMYRGSK